MARRSNRERARALQERMLRHAAAEVEPICATMSPEELAILMLPSRERTQPELGAAFAAHGLNEALLPAAVGPDGMRDEVLRKVRMEGLVRWTVWPRAREIRAVRARLEVEGRAIGKPPRGIDNEIERAYRDANRSL